MGSGTHLNASDAGAIVDTVADMQELVGVVTAFTGGTGGQDALLTLGTGGQDALFTLPGVAMGTPGYTAPEQLDDARSVDARADIYSVGATLYEMLAGRKPIEVDGFESWLRRLSKESAPPLASDGRLQRARRKGD